MDTELSAYSLLKPLFKATQLTNLFQTRTRMMKVSSKSLLSLMLLLLSFPVKGNTSLQQQLIKDLEEVSTILKRDHPASSSKLNDKSFVGHLTEGLLNHKTWANDVYSQEQYHAVLNSYMLGFNDMHLGFRPTNRPDRLTWSGMVFVLDNGKWNVFHASESWPSTLANVGDELLRCDGKSVDFWISNTLQRSIANENSAAQLARYSSWFFIGENGLPQFQALPKQCEFRRGEKFIAIDMSWQEDSVDLLYPLIFNHPNRPQAGFSISNMSDGYWIEMGALYGEQISSLVEKIDSRVDELVKAEFIVLDVRGNGGGDTAWSDKIAESVFGKDYISSIVDQVSAESYKASDENLALITSQLNNAISEFGKDDNSVEYHQKMFDAMQIALENGEDFAPPLESLLIHAPNIREHAELVLPKFKGQLFLLTDYGCFSSCLLMVNKFKQLGATTIGKVTNSMPRYYDMKLVPLSSGVGSIVTMTKVDMGESERIGPFLPFVKFEGFMDDTNALKAWFLNTVIGQ